MLTPQLISSLPTDHLVAAVEAEFDPRINTALEQELLNRLQDAQDDIAAAAPFVAVLINYELGPEELKALLDPIQEFGLEDAEELTAQLVLAKAFRDLANDADDVIERLQSLINQTQE